jgi:hypothetical protein
MAAYTRALDAKQGFNFKKDQQMPIGFLTNLKIGQEPFDRDFWVNSPMSATSPTQSETEGVAAEGKLQVVAVLKQIAWEMGDTESIDFEGVIGIVGKQKMSSLVYASMIDVDCEFGFTVYEYDPLNKKYYAAFGNKASGGTDDAGAFISKGQIKKDSGALQLTIEADADTDVESPINYKFTLKVVPKPIAQTLLFATSATRKVTKNWGRKGPI